MSKWSSAFRDSRWQKKRLEVLERDEWGCTCCGAEGEGVTLNVHHVYYESGKAPWEYDNGMLYTLCETCHAGLHDLQNLLLKRVLESPRPIALMKRLVGYVDACNGPCLHSGDEYERGYADCSVRCHDSIASALCKAAAGDLERRPL